MEHYIGPMEHYTGPMEHYTGPMEHYIGPMEHYIGPMEHYTDPVEHYTGPMEHYTDPVEHYSGPGMFTFADCSITNWSYSHPIGRSTSSTFDILPTSSLRVLVATKLRHKVTKTQRRK